MPAHIENTKELLKHKIHLLINAEMQVKDALGLIVDYDIPSDIKNVTQKHLE